MFLYAFRLVLISGASVALLVLSMACLKRVNPVPDSVPLVNVEQTIEAAVAATIAARPSPTPVLIPVPVTVPYPFRRRQVIISYNVDRHSLVELALDAAHASLQNNLDKAYLLTRDPLYSQVVQLKKQAQANVARLYRGCMCDEAFKAIAETTRCETLSDYLSQVFKSPPATSEDI